MSTDKELIEEQLRNIIYYLEASNEQKNQKLRQFLRKNLKRMDFDSWSYVICNYVSLDASTIRQFKDELQRWDLLSFINQWVLIDLIENDKDFMRQFRNELRWIQNFKG